MNAKTTALEFLPAALEIEQTPPLPISRYILWAIMLFFAIAIAWACIGQVDIVGVAHGKIVPSGHVKTIQPLETGIVKAINVVEGQRVAAKTVLVELDDTKARADLERLIEERHAALRETLRLNGQIAALDRFPTAQDYFSRAESEESIAQQSDIPPHDADRINARIAKELNQHYAEVAAITEQTRQNRAERETVERRIALLDATIPLIAERVDAIKSLETKSLAPRATWLELEEERVEQTREREVIRAQLGVSDAAYENLRQRRDAFIAKTHARWFAELVDTETRMISYDHEITKAETRVNEHRLTAPVAGTVQQLAVNTVGGVVTPAEKLMLIVPDEDALRVEAWIPNKDIGFVHEQQRAEIKVETFPFTKYGVIEGTIETISNDAIADDKLGLVYLAQVKMAKTQMWVNEKLVNLSPGMAVTVEADMGDRRLIEFLLAPLLRYRDEALTER